MATNPDTTSAPPPAGPLWPAPVFVLGVGALVAVCLCRPLFPANAARQVNQDLEAARKLFKRSDGDMERAIKLARRALDRAAQVSDRAGEADLLRGEANLLLGAAYVRLAEKEDDHAAEHWENAREALEQADSFGVKEDDRMALVYRLAKVGFHTNGGLEKVIARLEDCAEHVEARADAYDLLTRAYLRLPKPNLERALEANRKLREVADLSAAEMAQAQLTGSELLLGMKKPAEAAGSLVLIVEQPQTPPAILVRARLLLARCYQDQRRWDQAVTLYQAALADGRAPITSPAQVYYNLALCYRQLDQPKDAINALQKCVLQAQGPETQAGGIILAELRLLLEPSGEGVIEALTKAVERVESPRDWNNALVDLARAREVFEGAIESFRKAGRPEQALKALEPYARLALPRRRLEWRGLLSVEAARAQKGKGDAPALFRQAADAYGQAAALKGLKPAEVADFLWAAVPCHLSAGESEQAVGKLEALTKMELEPARMGEAWYLLGEEYRAGKDPKKAEAAYRECMKYATRFEYMARYQLAMALLAAGDLDESMAALKANISQLRFDTDNEAQAQSLLALGGILYRRGNNNFREAARNLESGLAKSRDKDKPDLAAARYQLADSYRQIAAQENFNLLVREKELSPETRAHFEKEHRDWLLKAAEEFAALDAFLETPEGQNSLTKEQRAGVPFITAKCWFNQGEYAKALKVYERLIERYKGKVEGLDALGGAVSCHAALGQVGYVRQKLLLIDQAIQELPPEIRQPWADWLKEALKGLKDI